MKILLFMLTVFLSQGVFSIEGKEKSKDELRFQKLDQFNKILFLIENNYYRELDFDKLIEGAMKGMMSTLDPHSAYLGKENFEIVNSPRFFIHIS